MLHWEVRFFREVFSSNNSRNSYEVFADFFFLEFLPIIFFGYLKFHPRNFPEILREFLHRFLRKFSEVLRKVLPEGIVGIFPEIPLEILRSDAVGIHSRVAMRYCPECSSSNSRHCFENSSRFFWIRQFLRKFLRKFYLFFF